MRPPARVLIHVLAVVAGFAAGVLGSFVHAVTWHGLPVGLVIALTLSLSVFVAAATATRSRSGAAAAVGGWLLPVVLLAARRPEGDLIVAGTHAGYAWLVVGVVLAAAVVAYPHGDSAAGGRLR